MLKRYIRRGLALLLALIICMSGLTGIQDMSAQAASDGMIRVLLTRVGTSRTSLTMKTGCAYAVGSASGERIASGSTVKVLLSGGSLYLSVNGEAKNMGSSVTLCRLAKGNAGVTFTAPSLANAYCGDLIFTVSSGAIQPVCRIYIEDYLYGVVAYEMSNSFPIEALKAQAICARTYAMRLKKSGGGYDVTDNTTHQVYKGYNAAYKNVIAAVDATKGQCLTYGGSYAGCWYTASNGGQTESTKNIWGGTVGYSTVKDDPYDLANPSSTAKRHSVYKKPTGSNAINAKLLALLKSGLTAQMQKLGLSASSADISIDEVVSIEPHTPKYAEPSRTYTKLRFGLRASSLNGDGERVSAQDALYVDLATYDQLAGLLSLDIGSTSAETVYVEDCGETFDIVFRRYGHGVGMSQRGAQQMAKENGMTCAQILDFYFTGTSLVTKNLADTTAQAAPEEPSGSEYGTLSYGDTGEDVKKLQTRLKELGYFDGDIGGNYLTKTTEAVKKFQEANGLEPDGVATAEMQEKLFAASAETAKPTPTPVPAETPVPTPTPDGGNELPESGNVLVSVPSGSKLVVYSKANTLSAIKGMIANGTVVRLYATSGSWAAISGSGLKGYVNKEYLAPISEAEPTAAPTVAPTPTPAPTERPSDGELEAGGYGIVEIPQGMRLRVFKRASVTSAKAGVLENGDMVRIHGLNSVWAAISCEGLKGYVNRKYISPHDGAQQEPAPAPTAAPTVAPEPEPDESGIGESAWRAYAKVNIPSSGRLGLRIEPESGAVCIAYLANGAKLKIYARAGDWARVSNGTKMGYVPIKYLRIYE